MKWQCKIDDLDVGTLVEIDVGDTIVRGRYQGLRRVDVAGHVKWYASIMRKGEEQLVCLREEALRVKVISP